MIYWRRAGTQLEMKFSKGPWHKRLWRWIKRRKPMTAGKDDYVMSLPQEWPEGTMFRTDDGHDN